ncbi:F-box domain [Dillenia turbinata]|uniref:F-box domain n=1 Tax=Dillenia turbinata TaxID=194707 RepID=A0AAN8UA18_9MAGN
MSVGILDESLSLVRLISDECNIWVMKEYGRAESWSKLYRIILQTGNWRLRGFVGNEIILEKDIREHPSYNVKNGECKDLGLNGFLWKLHQVTLMDGLLLLEKGNLELGPENLISNDQMSSHQFPNEIIIEILLRPPVKSLLKLRSVSKSWYSTVVHPSFIRMQATRARSLQKASNNSHLLHWPPGSADTKLCTVYCDRSFEEQAKLKIPFQCVGCYIEPRSSAIEAPSPNRSIVDSAFHAWKGKRLRIATDDISANSPYALIEVSAHHLLEQSFTKKEKESYGKVFVHIDAFLSHLVVTWWRSTPQNVSIHRQKTKIITETMQMSSELSDALTLSEWDII